MLENKLKQNKVSSKLHKVLITEEIVYKKLSSLKSNKPHEDNGMGSFKLNELDNEWKEVLTIIYNRSMSESKIPYDWKIVNTVNVTQSLKKVKSVRLAIIDQ